MKSQRPRVKGRRTENAIFVQQILYCANLSVDSKIDLTHGGVPPVRAYIGIHDVSKFYAEHSSVICISYQPDIRFATDSVNIFI